MSPQSPQALVNALTTPLKCDKEITEALRQFLAPNVPQPPKREKRDVRATVTTSQAAGKKETSSRKKSSAKVVVIYEEQPSCRTTPLEQHALAVEVVNKALQSITDIAKNRSTTQSRHSQHQQSDQISSPGRHLHEASPNERTVPTSGGGLSKRKNDSLPKENTEEHLDELVKCASLAFDYLRAMQEDRHASQAQNQSQLSCGLQSFISRLIDLGKRTDAARELEISHGLLERMLIQRMNTNQRKLNTNPVKSFRSTSNIGDLLAFKGLSTCNGSLQISVIGHQLLVLKYLACFPDPMAPVATISHLRQSSTSSPINLLLVMLADPGTRDAAAQKLEILAKTILVMVSLSSQQKHDALSSEAHRANFELQTLALEIRAHWMGSSSHRGNLDTEILRSFGKYLASFLRSSSMSLESQYMLAERFYRSLRALLERAMMLNKELLLQGSADVELRLQLSRVAEKAGLYTEASRMLDEPLGKDKCLDPSDINSSVWTCRKGAIVFRYEANTNDRQKALATLTQTSTSLQKIGKGTDNQLVQLLEEMHGCRSAWMSYFKACTKDVLDPCLSIGDNLEHSTISFLLDCSHVARKFVTRKLVLIKDENEQERAKSVLQLIKLLQTSVDSVIQGLEHLCTQDESAWTMVDNGLRECLTFLELFEANNMAIALSAVTSVVRSRISAAYWNYHVKLRRDPSGMHAIGFSTSLEKSCHILRLSHVTERLGYGLPYKLYKLGRLRQSLGAVEEAREAMSSSIEASVELGALEVLSPDSPCEAVRTTWEGAEHLQCLGTTLKWFLDLDWDDLCKSKLCPFYDNTRFTDIQRGLILEYQFVEARTIAESLFAKKKRTGRLDAIALGLLDICIKDVPLAQRLRAMLQILRLSVDKPDLLSESALSKALKESSVILQQHPMNNASPCQSLRHLLATLAVHVAVRNPASEFDLVEGAIVFWQSISQKLSSSQTLKEIVGDLTLWTSTLHSLTSFLEFQCATSLQVAVLTLRLHIMDVYESSNHAAIVDLSCKLVIVYSDMGWSCRAGMSLSKAEHHLKQVDGGGELHLKLKVASGEYYLGMGNTDKAEDIIKSIRPLFDQSYLNIAQVPKSRLFEHNTVFAEVFGLVSRLRLQTGALAEALVFAKRSVNILQRTWARLELVSRRNNDKSSPCEPIPVVELLSEDLSRLALRPAAVPQSPVKTLDTPHSFSGPSSWPVMFGLCKSFLHLAAVLHHFGLFQDASHYADQAYKLSQRTSLLGQTAKSLVAQGNYATCAGQLDEGKRLLDKAGEFYLPMNETIDAAKYYCSLGAWYRSNKQWPSELKAYGDAETIIQGVLASAKSTDIDVYQSSIKPSPTTKFVVSAKSQASSKLVNQAKVASATKKREISKQYEHADSPQLLRILNIIKQHAATSYILQGDVDAASRALIGTLTIKEDRDATTITRLINTSTAFRRAMKLMTTDPVFGILSESAISFPAAVSLAPRRTSQTPGKTALIAATSRRKIIHNSPQKGRKQVSVKQVCFRDLLLQAREQLLESRNEVHSCSTSIIYRFQTMAADLSMVLSSTGSQSLQYALHSISVAHALDLPKSIARQRDQLLVDLDIADRLTSQTDAWPSQSSTGSSGAQDLRPDFFNDLPELWTAISVTLSECQDHLYVVRYRSGQSPFILKLPLNRQNAHDVDEEDHEKFAYTDAKAEMIDIIKCSDATVHQARDQPDLMQSKEAKAQWWTEREALDQRLRNLLLNLENLWLGGFKGIFSRQTQHPELLARFQRSFEKILEKHLPSRQRAAKRQHQQPTLVDLDPRIYEIFVGLGDQADENTDLEEPLTDLLYFVVDVMQFNGEANAYDEIDFDAMIIDMNDAIHTYQDAVRHDSSVPPNSHTILVLDKRLQAFPWESMPCLEGQSVSRVPSLYCLYERIVAMQQQNMPASASPGYHVGSSYGTYILNPSSDLSKTQMRFENSLSTLATCRKWSSVIDRPPTESEFTAALTSSSTQNASLLLYFGHGSGAQYIRSRTIKRLAPRCNVALLFGCSSVSLTEAGEFEPYGTPKTYLAAGSPAVLGSLWDVTDGDVDKFAGGVLERWGLFEKGACIADGATAGKGKGGRKCKVSTTVTMKKDKGKACARPGLKMSLSDAVAQSREDCYLRYLNGAAMVVYGVPVYLRD